MKDEIRSQVRQLNKECTELRKRFQKAGSLDEQKDIILELSIREEALQTLRDKLSVEMPTHRVSYKRVDNGGDTRTFDAAAVRDFIENGSVVERESQKEKEATVDFSMDDITIGMKAITPRQRQVVEKVLSQNKTFVEVAQELGIDKSTVSRLYNRGMNTIVAVGHELKEQRSQLSGEEVKVKVIDLNEPGYLQKVIDALTVNQQLCMLLYYGEWLSTREIGRLLDTDHVSIYRTIQRGQMNLYKVAPGADIVYIKGYDVLEDLMIEKYPDLIPEDINKWRWTGGGRRARLPDDFDNKRGLRWAIDERRAADVKVEEGPSGKLLAFLEERRDEFEDKVEHGNPVVNVIRALLKKVYDIFKRYK